MNSLYDQLISIIGTPPNTILNYFLYVACVYIVISSVKLLYTLIFKFVLNIRL